MKIGKYAQSFKVKTFSAASVAALDKQIGEWQDENSSSLVLGMEFSSTYNKSYGKPFYAVLMTYQAGE